MKTSGASTTFLLPVALTSIFPIVHAWGNLGHETVGYIAQNYLQSQTVSWAKSILGSSSSSTTYLADVATWADTYRYTSAGSFSAPFHFIDANDSPPSSCNVDFSRDCHSEGCVVSAIANYTTRVQDTSLSSAQRKEALEFLTHFFGDVTQPLHDEAYEVGGNDIAVTFDGVKTNLHHIWDTNMPEKLVGGNTTTDAKKWATTLVKEIDTGDFASQKASWVRGMNLDDAQGSALAMAQDANAFVCSYTLKGGPSAVESQDLGGSYYQNAVPIVDLQIAKGGYRLAAWLNLIVTGSMGV